MKLARALLLAPALFIGCAQLSEPRPSASIDHMDKLTCQEQRDRYCIGVLWIRLKFVLDL